MTCVPPTVNTAHPLFRHLYSELSCGCWRGLGRQAESLTRDVNWASCKANSLVRVGISWGDSRHKSNSLLHAILKSSWVVHVVPVIIVDVHKCINKTHDRNPMLLASMKYLSDEIIQYMVFTRVERGFPP